MNREYDIDELLREFSSQPEPDIAPIPQPEPVPEEPVPFEPLVQNIPEELPPQPEREYPEYEQDHGYEEYREEYIPDYEDDEVQEAAPKKKNFFHEVLMFLASLAFLCVSAFALAWVGLNVHPDSGTATTVAGDTKLNLTGKLDVYMNNAASDALGDLAYIRKIYTIEESATKGPVPDPTRFGTTDDPAVIQALIDDAWELLEGQR